LTGLFENLKVDHFIFPHQLNLMSDKVLLVHLGEADIRDHSFLDQRILRQGMDYEWSGWNKFEAAAGTLPEKVPAYIFHVGHCGSTLLSRLVSAATGTQALREPLPLRTIAFDHADGRAAFLAGDSLRARLRLFEHVWARGPSKTVVKATSICTNLMELIDPSAPITFIYQQAETHLAVALAGENTLQDLRGLAQNRYRRLQESDIDIQPLAELTVGELAALSWLAEAVSANRALTQRSVMMLDFDGFLQQPDDNLAEVCRRLDLETAPEGCRIALNGPIMRTYSKAPEHAYGPELRNEIITESRVRNSSEIARGMRWLNRLAAQNAEIAAAANALSSGP
jgi:hypothetical protein